MSEDIKSKGQWSSLLLILAAAAFLFGRKRPVTYSRSSSLNTGEQMMPEKQTKEAEKPEESVNIEEAKEESVPQKERIVAEITPRKVTRPGISITYPQVSGLKNPEVQFKINQAIIEQIQQMVYSQIPDAAEIQVDYRVTYNQNGILSMVFEQYSYVRGAAHGMTTVESLTIDLENARIYTLKDLFNPGSNYVETINNQIKLQIKERDIPMLKEFDSISENQQFYLTEKDIVIYFQLYEYTPYVYGIPEFPIPIASMVNMINKDGPLGKL
ncbi:MAG: DUF3298 and DUF4163 domain-containing protein [Clostridiaceae bacterium]|nr:DUF3298 and DUF4163 domain-containing protein [Clostridiaceae bacterium]